jgi:uncharacterized protein (DUF1778 family)
MSSKAEKVQAVTAKEKAKAQRTRRKDKIAAKNIEPKYERLEAKVSPETKRLAERAALVSELTLTDYLAKLIREDAPKTIKAHTEIQLTNQHFDYFIALCDSSREPSEEILKAANLLDKEGF